uniref:Secreted protein n=1 Tax=Macrostomum lignano TaxID=282301 RepID=A0A1I8GBA3_9PLAT
MRHTDRSQPHSLHACPVSAIGLTVSPSGASSADSACCPCVRSAPEFCSRRITGLPPSPRVKSCWRCA